METNQKPGFINPEFRGQGAELFGIEIVNVILCVLTLGLYYPWAKARSLRFYYGNTYFMGDPFTFHGTGREMFIGMLKAFAAIAALVAIVAIGEEIGLVVAYLCAIALTPIAVHGALSYRMSHTSWRGIYFGYRGDLGQMMGLYFKGLGLTLITFGIYGPWFIMDWNRYIMGHLRAGSAKFGFEGKGADYLGIALGGYLLTIVTFGIYGFWWIKNMFNYFRNNSYIQVEDDRYFFEGDATAGDVFNLTIGNFLLIFLTLGIGTPWAIIRSLRFTAEHTLLHSEFDPSNIEQTEPAFKDATGEMLLDL